MVFGKTAWLQGCLAIGAGDNNLIRHVRFGNLVINGVRIKDNMLDKPDWYKAGDMARIFVGEHTEGVTFE